MVAGIILAAVGDELAIAHPTEELPAKEIAAVVAGPAIYLLGHALFRLRMAGSVSWKRLAGAAGCGAAGVFGSFAPALAVATLVLLALVGVIAAEHIAAVRRAARGEPSPLERLEAAS
jgi:low temperature requirement protein LtrA